MQNAHYYNEKYNLLHTRNTYYTRDYTKLRPSDKPTQYTQIYNRSNSIKLKLLRPSDK